MATDSLPVGSLSVLFLVLPSFLAASLGAATLRVPAEHPDVQTAIDAASIGDTVLVAPGEYVVTQPIDFRAKSIALRSEKGPRETVLRMSETPADPDRASVVVFENGEGRETVLEGFTVTGGQGTRRERYGWVGGGLLIEAGWPQVIGCIIEGNSARDLGGGVYDNGNRPVLKNCILARNRARRGSALFAWDVETILVNCTVTGNNAEEGGPLRGGGDDGGTTVVNCILWGNTPDDAPQGDFQLDHSLVGEDPLFADALRGDYRVRPGSPAADAGTPERAPVTDIDGRNRPCGAAVDIGAHEDGDCPPPELFGLDIQVAPLEGGTTDPPPGAYAFRAGTVVRLEGIPAPGYRFGSWYVRTDPDDRYQPEIELTIVGDVLKTSIWASFFQRAFVRGDANADGALNITDPVRVLIHLFLGRPLPCERAADVNDDGRLDLADPIALLSYLFLRAAPPPPPFRSCNGDDTADALACESFPACQG